jgi:methyl-accepting chemotaxis protein
MMRDVSEVNSRSQAIAAATEELVASVDEISRNSTAAAEDARSAQATAAEAERAADQAVTAMRAVAHAVEDAAAKVGALAEASTKIGDIVGQIEAIAKQTNMLALNATIEAARAGDAGKGFAVVAGEVKSLANQTAKATVDIKERIGTLRHEMDEIVVSMEHGAAGVKTGEAAIDATGADMRRVLAQVDGVSSKMADIANILGQQAEASTEVAQGIADIAAMAEHNVGSIGEVLNVMDESTAQVAKSIAELGERDIEDYLIHVAKSDHVIWRKKLADMVAGRATLNPDELADHHRCRMGKWYDSNTDAELREHPAFRALAEPHRLVHAHGIEAARRYKAGDLGGALDEIAKASEASKDVLRCLDELAIRHAGPPGSVMVH